MAEVKTAAKVEVTVTKTEPVVHSGSKTSIETQDSPVKSVADTKKKW